MVKAPSGFYFLLFSPLFLTYHVLLSQFKFEHRLQLFIVMSVRCFNDENHLVLSGTLQLNLIKSVLVFVSCTAGLTLTLLTH